MRHGDRCLVVWLDNVRPSTAIATTNRLQQPCYSTSYNFKALLGLTIILIEIFLLRLVGFGFIPVPWPRA